MLFSPYSRGWSLVIRSSSSPDIILPVFAGMVPHPQWIPNHRANSPRIRGDGPCSPVTAGTQLEFSPYSRGWSATAAHSLGPSFILPVFAGMVPAHPSRLALSWNSPRIRGDGPVPLDGVTATKLFSPYSRGWSLLECFHFLWRVILPVFAGMVPVSQPMRITVANSPRIRGDGPISSKGNTPCR